MEEHGHPSILYEDEGISIHLIDTLAYGQKGVSASYLLNGGKRGVLLDPGLPSSLETVIKEVEKTGLKIDEIDSILVTHSHPDHAGCLKKLLDRNEEMRVFAGERAVHFLRGMGSRGLEDTRKKFGEAAVRKFGEIEDVPEEKLRQIPDEGIHLGNLEIEPILTPGHEPDHVSYFLSGPGILFAGDATAFHHPDLPVLVPPPSLPSYKVEETRNSLEKLMGLDPLNAIYLSHFGKVPIEPSDYLNRSIELVDSWQDMVKNMMKRDMELNEMFGEVKKILLNEAKKEEKSLDLIFSELYFPMLIKMILKGYIWNFMHDIPW